MLAWPSATVNSSSVTHIPSSTSETTDYHPLLLDDGGVSTKVSACLLGSFVSFGFMFDQNDNCLLSLGCVFFCKSKFLQIWSNHFLHHFKASVFSLVALLSLDQDRLFYKHSQNHCIFLYLDLLFQYLFFQKQVESLH